MQLAGYEVRQGKHLSFRAPEQKNFTYMKSLGSYYSEENVRIRLAKNRGKVKTPKHLSREARLYINITTYVTTGNREGFERWAKLNNLKEAARTFNYLSENNLLNYEDFQQHISDVDASVKAAEQRIIQINSELSTQKIIQKHCDSYRLCRKVIENAKSVAMAMYGVNIGLLAYFDSEMTCNQACCVFSDKRDFSSKHYLYYYLKSIREYLLLISFGAAQQNLSQDLIKKIKITMPSDDVVQAFEKQVDDIYGNIRMLLLINKNLAEQRDMLLPRLMSGKLEV